MEFMSVPCIYPHARSELSVPLTGYTLGGGGVCQTFRDDRLQESQPENKTRSKHLTKALPFLGAAALDR